MKTGKTHSTMLEEVHIVPTDDKVKVSDGSNDDYEEVYPPHTDNKVKLSDGSSERGGGGFYTALTNAKVKGCVGSKWYNCVILQKRQKNRYSGA